MSASHALAEGRPRRFAAPPAESRGIQTVKATLFIAAAAVLLGPLATTPGIVAAIMAVIFAFWGAARADRKGMTTRAALLLGLVGCLASLFVSNLLRDNGAIAMALGVRGAVWGSDIALFGPALAAGLLPLRLLARRHRIFTVVEAAFIALSVIYLFAAHQDLHLNQPRYFSDWLLSAGQSPTTVLLVIGLGTMVLVTAMFMRQQSGAKTLLSTLLVILVAIAAYLLFPATRIAVQTANNPYSDYGDDDKGGSGKDGDGEKGNGGGKDGDGKGNGGGDGKPGEDGKDGDGKGSAGGKGDGKGDGKGSGGGGGSGDGDSNNPSNNRPDPVAVVTFHDDYESRTGLLYFRQQVQSLFDATHLSVDASGKWDRDVITTYPTDGPVVAGPGQNLDVRRKIPTSVFLLRDHPQPMTLAHAGEVRPLDNPDPRVFVAAYSVTSYGLSVDYSRLRGRQSIPDDWDAEAREHYLAIPDDPRYEALSDILLRDIDPRYADDALVKALTIAKYLENNGYYTLKQTYNDAQDPTAAFLFGTMRGYCVHFAHSAAFLFRSQGIAARVAVGYASDTRRRSGGSNLAIQGTDAHAWPEIHLDGIGWITFDIYPQQGDEPRPDAVDQDLESLLGEMARKDPTGGRGDEETALEIPWSAIGYGALALLLSLIALAFAIKWTRRLIPRLARPSQAALHRWAVRGALDRLSDLGVVREVGETRESFARRVTALTPSLLPLTYLHLAQALGRPANAQHASGPGATERARQLAALYDQVCLELKANVPMKRRALAAINPIGWWFTR